MDATTHDPEHSSHFLCIKKSGIHAYRVHVRVNLFEMDIGHEINLYGKISEANGNHRARVRTSPLPTRTRLSGSHIPQLII